MFTTTHRPSRLAAVAVAVALAVVTASPGLAATKTSSSANRARCEQILPAIKSGLGIELELVVSSRISASDTVSTRDCLFTSASPLFNVAVTETTATTAAAFKSYWSTNLIAVGSGIVGVALKPVKGSTDQAHYVRNEKAPVAQVALMYVTSPTTGITITMGGAGKGKDAVMGLGSKLLAMPRVR